MPLIKCPDCGRDVSDLAPACPNCGRPIASEVSTGKNRPAKPEEVLYEDTPCIFRDHPGQTLLAILLCVVLIGFYLLAKLWLDARSKRLIITTRRTILRTGIFSKNTNEILHRDIRNVVVRQDLIDRMLGVGTLAISSAGQDTMEIVVPGMRNPARLVELIRTHQEDAE